MQSDQSPMKKQDVFQPPDFAAGPYSVICDFDGTVTPFDVTDAILERFARPAWKAIEDEWVRGGISARECMERQIPLIEAPLERLDAFLDTVPVTKKYHIGESCLISPRMDIPAYIRARFLPLAERMSRRFGYSTILYARNGYDAVCVERLDGWHPIQVFLNKVGDRRPLGMGSATLSILAALPEDEAETILSHNEHEIRFVLKTDFSVLRGFLSQARRDGYAITQGMLLEETIGISHALHMGSEVVGSIAIDAVRSDQWDADQPNIIQELQKALP